MNQIATDPQVGLDDKKGMIEMLRRFEKQGEDNEGLNLGADEGEDEEEDELETKLRGIDLGMSALSLIVVGQYRIDD